MIDKLLWVVQVVLAPKLATTAFGHAFRTGGRRWQHGLERMGRRAGLILRVSALFCLLGAVGLILPAATGILP